jgi:hypothetical protein
VVGKAECNDGSGLIDFYFSPLHSLLRQCLIWCTATRQNGRPAAASNSAIFI